MSAAAMLPPFAPSAPAPSPSPLPYFCRCDECQLIRAEERAAMLERLVMALAERVWKQSELLSRRAEKK